MSTPTKGRPGGVLPITAAATRKPNPPQKSSPRTPAPRTRLIIRRLSPGLTEAEFWETLGTEWQVGQGKVDWFSFKPGKISDDPSKPSRPARAYFKVKDQTLLELLSTTVKQAQFKDAKNTGFDPCLIGPPSLEFAPYNKVPSSRIRHDGRQGTIDQDPEFIDFLHSLTEPTVKPSVSGEAVETKPDRVITTPLVQFIKEKKASKAKEKEATSAAKSSKKNQDSKENKVKGTTQPAVIVKSKDATGEKTRVAKATLDTVNAIQKSVASMQKPNTPRAEGKAKQPAATPPPAVVPTPPPARRERERGNASVAAKLISRDLGLAPKEARPPRTPRAANNAHTTPSNAERKPATSPAATTAAVSDAKNTPSAAATTPTGAKNNRATPASQPSKSQASTPKQAKSANQSAGAAKSAFLKHTNPSQGITEELLRATFGQFGEITRCEIDKKKGLGYIDFTSADALKQAMAASPVKVANGQVVVLENRSPYGKTKGSAAKTENKGSPSSNHVAPASATTVTTPPDQPIKAPPPAEEALDGSVTIPGDGVTPPASANSVSASNTSKGGKTSTSNAKTGRGAAAGRGARGNFRGRSRGGRGSAGAAGAPGSDGGKTPSSPALAVDMTKTST